MQGQFQGFVAKLDPPGKIVYSTIVGALPTWFQDSLPLQAWTAFWWIRRAMRL